LGFILLIVIGGILLALPIANHQNIFTSLDISFFTAISAVTVTGHTVVPTSTYWSGFGQSVIFVLMLVGGLGFMVVSTFLLLVIGQRSTLQERMLSSGFMRDTVGMEGMQGLRRIGRNVVLLVLVLYALGTVGVFWQVSGLDGMGSGESLWNSAFLSVSAFNNAGFNILPESPTGSSLARFATNPILLLMITVLIVLGGLGWTVLLDIYRHRRFPRLGLDAKLVVVTSLALWVFGAGVLLLAEFSNPATLGALDWSDRLAGAVFGSASGRTAGFTTIDFGQVKEITKLTYTGLMFIGGGAGSVAGGIKVVTFAVIVAAVVSSLRGRSHAEAFGREIHQSQVHRALAVAVLGVAISMVLLALLTLTDPAVPFLDLLFDTVSALGTTGASTGIVPDLSLSGKAIFMVAMFVGRLGPVTLALTLVPREEATVYRFVRERVKIG
jgi:trk system potassium uptake protein TrkH